MYIRHSAMKRLLLLFALLPSTLHAQARPANPSSYEGIWEGYDGELGHVSRQLIALAEAIPADKYSWRPAPGVRSVSEVLMHIAIANDYLLSVTGVPMPPDITSADVERTVSAKPAVIASLKRSLAAVHSARSRLKPGDLERKVIVQGKAVPVEGIYLRILVHNNEHMGQLVAYARFNGIVPPWSLPLSTPAHK